MALSSNGNTGSTETKVGAGALSNFNTENKSNGNFSGGDINFDTNKLSINNPFDTKESQQPTFNTDDVFNPNVSGNLDIDLPKTNNNNSSSSNTTYSNNLNEPTMTVDEVYGKSSNQPVVEKQGDYSASSNEKSNVETSTFGKQDEVSVTPTSVTENKGLVGNATIQSAEGLDFQQKDKASVDVLDSKKKRDEVEAKDKANSMRNQLKANVNNAKQEEGGEDFRIGDRDEDLAAAKTKADEAEKAYKDLQAQVDDRQAELNAATDNLKKARIDVIAANGNHGKYSDFDNVKSDGVVTFSDGGELTLFTNTGKDLTAKAAYGARNKAVIELSKAEAQYNAAQAQYDEVKAEYNKAKARADQALADYKSMVNNTYVGEEAAVEKEATTTSNAEKATNLAKDAIKNSENATPEQKAQAEEAITNLEDSRRELEEAAAKARSGNPADMVAYQEALKKYNKNLKEAQKIGNRFTQTDFNEKYTTAIAQANDFEVTLSDGTKMEYSDFATEEATKSPQYAKAMYEAKAKDHEEKAKDYEENGHPIQAKIERWKAKIERVKAEMSQTWLGSKLTFADNQVRGQFVQMAKADMRATYAAYNNVLTDTTGKYSDKDKEEASAAINQANALMTASAALQATTGFMSSIGDDPSDGTFGTTDPEARNAWQKTLNTVDNIIRITLGLGILPAANKAYQNMYYMAGDKVNHSFLFNKDFDGDGFALCQEYGNHAATGMIAGFCELGVGVAMLFNPASIADGIDLIVDAVLTFNDGLYGVRNAAEESQRYTQEVLKYFKEAQDIAESSGNEEAVQEITNAITQIENFELKADEVGNLDNWLEGSGSNTATNEKFNQSLTYDEWLKLIEADPTMREYAKSIAKKKDKNAQKDNADAGVNS